MQITRTSMFTGTTRTLELPVTQEQLDLYANTRSLIQDIFPCLDKEQREFLITGTTSEEWAAVFGDEV